MGGKGSAPPTSSPAPPQTSEPDIGPMMAEMNANMMKMMMMTSQDTSYTPPPAVESMPQTDWAAKQAELKSQAELDNAAAMKKKRGRASTVLTSPLEEENKPKTVSTTLTGE